jgi:myo-inositol-1(or 4)-monophosphatase
VSAPEPGQVAELAELAELAEEAARRAGALLVEGQARRHHVDTKSSATDMVTEMDRASEDLIRSLLMTARPHDRFLGEEEGEEEGEVTGSSLGGVRWIVDPLDGTTNYLYGFPAWSVSIAAEIDGTVSAAVVYDPARDELFRAVKGEGATAGGQRVRGSTADSLSTALVATGFAYDPGQRAEQARWAAYVLPRVRDIRRAGSAALDLCWVAAGRVDAYYEQGTRVWDWAAGTLVAAEAGAWVGGFDGGPPGPDGVVAAAPALATPLLDLLGAARRDGPTR